MKVVRVIPIFLASDPNQIENYDPVSIQPIFCKVLEKVVFKQLYNFLQKFSLLHSAQFGFRIKLVHLKCNILYFTAHLRQI